MLKRVRLIIIWYEVWLSLWFEMFGPLLGALGRLLELFVSRISRNVTAISLSIRMRLRSLGVSRMPIKVIYPPIDLKRIIGVNPASFLTDITFVGRLFSYKNIYIILNALIELRDKGMNLRCLIIGEGPQENALRDKVKRNNLEEWVVFKYFAKEVNEVYSYLKSSKILAFPSRREGFGVICIEAQACGLPVIGLRSRFNADEELILDGFNGFVLDKDDCNELAGKIRLLIENERLRERFSANAFQFSQKFDQDISVEELFDYFKEIMER
jgi:glycosyltransferase involved in cell wall biosynthesis